MAMLYSTLQTDDDVDLNGEVGVNIVYCLRRTFDAVLKSGYEYLSFINNLNDSNVL